MTTPDTPGSKPNLVSALTDVWRKSAEHAAEQISRFVRLTILAAIPSVVNLIGGGKFDWRTLLAFILPFAEVAFRQVWPALTPAKLDKAPGATIVPAEVCGPDPLTGVVPPPDEPVVPVIVRGPANAPEAAKVTKVVDVKKTPAKKAPAKKTAAKKTTNRKP